MKNRSLILSLLLTGFLIVMCGVFWRTSKGLQMENEALRTEIAQLNAAARVAPPDPDQTLAAEFETQKRELLRLRNEVAQLRSSRDAARG